MKKVIPLLQLFLFIQTAIAQTGNVGIGTVPDASAALEIKDAGRGLLIPRVALTATNAASPITAPAVSLLVYNTANASSGATLVTPGYYYWDGAKWIRLVNAKSLNANNGLTVVGDTLIQLGGAITQPTAITGLTATNKLTMTGTGVDAINLASNTLSVDATNGRVGIGLDNPSEKLSVSGNVLVTNLSGTGTRPVAATSNGTLTTLNRSSTNSQFFTSSGTYSVPAGVQMVYVELVGGGGGAAYYYYTNNVGGGGGGGFVSGALPVTPGESLTITVGAGGASVSSNSNGKKGSGSAIYRSTTLLCAAGGGGAGNYYPGSTGYGLGGGSSGFGSSIDGVERSGTSGTGYCNGGNNNVDYLIHPLSLAGNCDYSQQNFYNFAAQQPSGVVIDGYPFGRGGINGKGAAGLNGCVLIYY